MERHIGRCLDSLLRQAGGSVEIIVVDDGSTDQTAAVASRLAQDHPSLRVIRQSNSGVVAARERGVAQSSGEWVTFVDADDWVDEGFLDVVLRTSLRAETDLIQTGFDYVTEEGVCLETILPAVSGVHSTSTLVFADTAVLLKYITNSIWAKFYRRTLLEEVLDQVGSIRIAHSEDILFATAAFLNAREIGFIRSSHYRYLQREGSAIHSFNQQLIPDRLRFLGRLKDILSRSSILSEDKKMDLLEAHENLSVSFVVKNLRLYSPSLQATNLELQRLRSAPFYSVWRSCPKKRIQRCLQSILIHSPRLFYLAARIGGGGCRSNKS